MCLLAATRIPQFVTKTICEQLVKLSRELSYVQKILSTVLSGLVQAIFFTLIPHIIRLVRQPHLPAIRGTILVKLTRSV